MIARCLIILIVSVLLSPIGCGYRFVEPFPASDYALVSVNNASSEPGLATVLEEMLRKNGGFRENSENRLSVTVTDFTDTVESVGSSGTPVRQNLKMEIAWKIQGTKSAQAAFGSEVVTRSYPYSADLSILDWNRNAAVSLLAEMGAMKILESLGDKF